MRNLGLIISFWLSVIFIPTNSLALGLGEIQINSFLNQPLKAEIEVISARAGEVDDLLVGLASRDAFTRAGLSRPNNLSNLQFTVQKSEEGDSAVILVTTKAAIKEPFLNFLVEADWSKGRLLREFTVLLDPPFYADSPAPAPAAAPQPEPVPEPEEIQAVAETTAVEPTPEFEVPAPIVETEPVETTSTSEQQTITEPIAFSENDQNVREAEESTIEPPTISTEPSSSESVVVTGDIAVDKGDTLWSIASGLQNSGYSMSQIMLAIQRANPDAFGDDNINNLKVGSVLRVPDASDYGEVDQQQAYAQVLEQNGLWDDYVARVTGQADVAIESESDSSTQGGDTADTPEQTSELSLVAPGDGESDAAGMQSEGDDANELRVQLALTEEELDASAIENAELSSRIRELEARLSKFEEMQKMMEIEDDTLAKLQEQQAQESEEVVSSEAIEEAQKADDVEALLDEVLPEDPEEVANAATTDDSMVEEESQPEITSPAVEEAAPVEEMAPVVSDSDTMTDDSLEAEQSSEAPPVPVIVTEPQQKEPSFLDGIIPVGVLEMLPDLSGVMPSSDSLSLDPIMLGGLGGIILLIVGLVIYKRRKAASDDDVVVNDPIFAMGGDEEEDLTPIHLAEGSFEGLEDDSEVSLLEDTALPTSMEVEEEIEEDDFSKTAVISREEMPTPEAPAAPAVDEQDDILNEADVYLAYNLYDNAEDLLTSSLETSPERADYRSKLLDTYFAAKNANAFVSEAETLKSMGAAADQYWNRVMVMGFELAPTNALFADAKDSGISAADLEIAKPAAADFDLGTDEDDTNFSTTDFDLGEEDTNTFEATDFSPGDIGGDLDDSLPELPDLDEEDRTNLPNLAEAENDVPDEIGDLDFSFDEPEDDAGSVDLAGEDDDDLDFGLPDDLDLGGDSSDNLDIESTSVIEAGTGVIDTDAFTASLEDDEDDVKIEATAILDTDDFSEFSGLGEDDKSDSGDDLDFGMEDTALIDSVSEIDDDAIELGDFEDELLSMDVDISEDPKTGTFAPGDFDDIDADLGGVGIDGIEDLMLPDDVDEVSTKLDLARAFIDMGDAEGARSSLDEVMTDGNEDQKAEAQALLDQI